MPAVDQNRLQISPIQTVAGAMAAVTAAVVGSRLGIAGTILGAGAGSIMATTGSAIYGHWIGRTASRVRTVVLPAGTVTTPLVIAPGDPVASAPAANLPTAPAAPYAPPARRADRRRGRSFGFFVLGGIAMFAAAIGTITAFEAVTGHPLAFLTGADQGSGTTLGRAIGEADTPPAIAPLNGPTTETPSPDPSETPSSTPEVTTPTTSPTPTTTDPATETPPPTSSTPSPDTPPTGP